MAKFEFNHQPKFTHLTEVQLKTLHEKSLEVLEKTGVYFQSEEVLKVLENKGCNVNYSTGIAKFEPKFITESLESVPETFELYDRDGNLSMVLGDGNFTYDPGSSGLFFLESDNLTARDCVANDLKKIYIVADALDHIGLQATALAPSDVPTGICDVYRVYLALKNSSKPVLTGAFGIDGVNNIASVIASVTGGLEALRKKPSVIFDVCATSPLEWNHISCQNLLDLARLGLPIETISVPMPGAASPVTLAGSMLIHLAETLSGIAVVQSVNPGNPMIFGGAPMTFDMRTSTTSLNSVESSILSGCCAQLARYYGMPSHCYAGLSDSKVVDAQAGLETALSSLAAVLGGVNIISGSGMLDFVNTFSLEKLVIDNEIAAMTKHIHKGINISDETLALNVIDQVGHGGDYLSQKHTMQWFKRELYIPSLMIDKQNRGKWEKSGKENIFDRARCKVEQILENHKPTPLGKERDERLDEAFKQIMRFKEIVELPFVRS